MVDTLDLKSNEQYVRAGSSPAPGTFAGIAQLVEHDLAKVGVASSSLVSRSEFTSLSEYRRAFLLGKNGNKVGGASPDVSNL